MKINPSSKSIFYCLKTTLLVLFLPFLASASVITESDVGNLKLTPVENKPGWFKGTFEVYENRIDHKGRKISLNVLVLKARSKTPRPDPVFFLAGGPGQGATTLANGLSGSWMRRDRDIVLVDQRGTGRSNPLKVSLPGTLDNPQGYLENIFQVDVFKKAIPELQKRADLRYYTTPIAMDDLDDVRKALGYNKINLVGGSYGTRAALVYMRRHEEHVRAAILMGVAPIAFRNPLYHAKAAQEGLERIFEECENDPKKNAAFPNLRKKFAEIIARLEKQPAKVSVTIPGRNEKTIVRLTKNSFCEALRILMYYTGGNRQVPSLLMQAWEGKYETFAQAGIVSNRNLRNSLALGMLMCVTGAEDLPRIEESDIEKETKGTFLGDVRVRSQLAVGKIWPKGIVPDNYGDPVSVKIPTLVISGTHDPVTPPRWGAEAARHLPNSVHLVLPATHSLGGLATEIKKEFLGKGVIEDLDLTSAKEIRLPPFRVWKQ